MNDPEKLREIGWRRPLTDVEKAALRESLKSEPKNARELESDLELDSALTAALNRIPDAPVSSNFTARVMAAVEREQKSRSRTSESQWSWRVLFPRIAFAASGVFTVAAIFILVSHHQQAQARQLAESVVAVSNVSALPSPDVLQDFEAIRQLNATPAPDEQLLALFQ